MQQYWVIHDPVYNLPIEEHFWFHVVKSEGDACWIWTGGKQSFGYGSFRDARQRKISAHRFSWEIHYGPIPKSLCVLHRCDNPPCVNPEHLLLGTAADNNADMKSKGRGATGTRNGAYTHPERILRGDQSNPRRFPESYPRGEKAWRAKFTNGQVLEIRQRYANGESQASLAKTFATTRENIYLIVHRKNWKHI